MDCRKVVSFEYLKRGGKLVFVICILLAGSALRADKAQARKRGYTVAQRHSRDDNAVVPGLGLEVGKLHSGALGPEPHAVCGHFPLGTELFVQRVMLKDAVCSLHESAQNLCVFAAGGQDSADLLA